MEEIILEAEQRLDLGKSKVKALRDKGFIPGVVYAEGKESHAIRVSHREFLRMIHQHGADNLLVNVKIKDDQKNKARTCLIKEIQYDPVKGDVIHVDFNEISLTKAIKVNVGVVAKGEPIGVKQEGGSLEHILWEIEVECLPTDIPKEIEVDVSQMKIGDSIHIKDIHIPDKVKVLTDLEAVVLSVAAPVKVEEILPAEAAEGEVKQEPEVIKEKKEVPAEAEGEEKEGKDKEKEKK